MKHLTFLLILAIPSMVFAADWKSFGEMKYDSLHKRYYVSFYDKQSLYSSGDYVVVWARARLSSSGKNFNEYLTEFNCRKGQYRQLGLRSFVSDTPVPTDAIYRQWFDVPDRTQDLGVLFGEVCTTR